MTNQPTIPLPVAPDDDQENSKLYWQSEENYNYVTMFPDRHKNQVAFATEWIIPRLKPADHLLDIGCANGWFTLLLAPHCAAIDAYDLSEKLLAQARDAARLAGTTNIIFSQADVLTLKLARDYQHATCMGLLSYVVDDRKMVEIVAMIARHLPRNGSLAIKESISLGEDVWYRNDIYRALYRGRDKYVAMIEQAGFRHLTEGMLSAGVSPEGCCSKYFLFEKNV